MTNFKLSLGSTTYRNYILDGFSRLQQNDEFVDMTLAADGHLVKVHRNIVALASPYLKELLRSVPSSHPVIFLNDVSHDLLCFILEYMYRGEVQIPVEKVQPLLKVGQALHIAGLKNINPLDKDKNPGEENQTTHVSFEPNAPPPLVPTGTTNENKLDLQMQETIVETPVAATAIKLDLQTQETIFKRPVAATAINLDLQTQDTIFERPVAATAINLDLQTQETIFERPVAATAINLDLQTQETIIERLFAETENNLDLQTHETMIKTPVDATENNLDLQTQEAIIKTVAATEKEPNYDIPYSTYAPTMATFEPSWSQGNMKIQSTTNTNSHGKSINVIMDDCAMKNNVTDRPVAKIEILSDTIINRSVNTTIVGNTQFNLPQLYTPAGPAILNTSNQHVLISNNKTNIAKDSSVGSNKIDLNNLLNMGGKLLLPHYNTSEDIIMSDFGDSDDTAAESTDVNNTEDNDDKPKSDIDPGTIVYTISNRGALQMILNDFMYNCHYKTDNGRKRRWRCIEYRDHHCRAFIGTNGEKVEARKLNHSHPNNHAVKIKTKMARSVGKIYSTIQEAEDSAKKVAKVLTPEEMDHLIE